MSRHEIKLQGPGILGTEFDAAMMGVLLSAVVEAVQGSLRLRVEGRSTARGPVPGWLRDAARLKTTVLSGSTVLSISCPRLVDANPGIFQQQDMFNDLPDPQSSAFELFHSSLQSVVEEVDGEVGSTTYDDGLLEIFGKIAPVFDAGVETIDFVPHPTNGRFPTRQSIQLTKSTPKDFEKRRQQLPSPRVAMAVGVLNEIRSDNSTFRLVMPDGILKGSVKQSERKTLRELWGKSVLAEGVVKFGKGGIAQHLQAHYVRLSTDQEKELVGQIPVSAEALPIPTRQLKKQGPRSGINALVGSWPGGETDEAFESLLEELLEIRRES